MSHCSSQREQEKKERKGEEDTELENQHTQFDFASSHCILDNLFNLVQLFLTSVEILPALMQFIALNLILNMDYNIYWLRYH